MTKTLDMASSADDLVAGLIEVPHEFSGDVVIAHQSLVGIRPQIASRCNATVFLQKPRLWW